MSVPEIGATLGGKYLVMSTLGRGGMGTVLRAKNQMTGKEVALKWMHSSAGLSSEASARLLREAEAASRLNHPNVVNVFDVMYEGETLFLVMELLEGETLRVYLDRERTPNIASLVALLLPAMHGVAAAHERGVIHRDLKPDNIFLVRGHGNSTPHAKVVDFGVAKVLNSDGLTLTRTGTSLGTPLYMSLEQLRADDDIDQRTDVYAFGVILYEAITGRLPYTATTLTEFAIRVATTSPVPIKQLRPDVPSTLANLVHWAIARNREERLPDMGALIRELEPFAREHSFLAELSDPQMTTPPLPAAAVQPSADSLRETSAYATPTTLPFAHERDSRQPAAPQAKRSSRSHWAMAAAALLALLAALSYWLRPGAPQQAEAPQQLVRPAAVPPQTTTDLSAATTQAPEEPSEEVPAGVQPGVEQPTDTALLQPPPAKPAAGDRPVKRPAPRTLAGGARPSVEPNKPTSPTAGKSSKAQTTQEAEPRKTTGPTSPKTSAASATSKAAAKKPTTPATAKPSTAPATPEPEPNLDDLGGRL
jgi:eukaryotic-like serine/threonine-protein kinase